MVPWAQYCLFRLAAATGSPIAAAFWQSKMKHILQKKISSLFHFSHPAMDVLLTLANQKKKRQEWETGRMSKQPG